MKKSYIFTSEDARIVIPVILLVIVGIVGLLWWAISYSLQATLITMFAVKLINSMSYKGKKLF